MRSKPTMGSPLVPRTATRASDEERDRTLALLREHHVAGRLTQEEFEERTEEACRARFHAELWHAVRELPVPRPQAQAAFVRPPASDFTAALALALALLACLLLVFSFGLLFVLYLPLGAGGWLLGRRARRAAGPGSRGMATAAEVLGIIATLAGLLALVGCAGLVAAV